VSFGFDQERCPDRVINQVDNELTCAEPGGVDARDSDRVEDGWSPKPPPMTGSVALRSELT
jgi:hypothetical protein